MKKRGADYQLITASENNAWLLNIRGKDVKYSVQFPIVIY